MASGPSDVRSRLKEKCPCEIRRIERGTSLCSMPTTRRFLTPRHHISLPSRRSHCISDGVWPHEFPQFTLHPVFQGTHLGIPLPVFFCAVHDRLSFSDVFQENTVAIVMGVDEFLPVDVPSCGLSWIIVAARQHFSKSYGFIQLRIVANFCLKRQHRRLAVELCGRSISIRPSVAVAPPAAFQVEHDVVGHVTRRHLFTPLFQVMQHLGRQRQAVLEELLCIFRSHRFTPWEHALQSWSDLLH
jgi:hypothetical protein